MRREIGQGFDTYRVPRENRIIRLYLRLFSRERSEIVQVSYECTLLGCKVATYSKDIEWASIE